MTGQASHCACVPPPCNTVTVKNKSINDVTLRLWRFSISLMLQRALQIGQHFRSPCRYQVTWRALKEVQILQGAVLKQNDTAMIWTCPPSFMLYQLNSYRQELTMFQESKGRRVTEWAAASGVHSFHPACSVSFEMPGIALGLQCPTSKEPLTWRSSLLGIPSLQNWRNKFIFFINNSVCSIQL